MSTPFARPVTFGTRRAASVTAGVFLVSDAWFPGKDALPPHHHDRTVVGITLSGQWDSVVGRRTLDNRQGTIHTEPAGDTHSNHFGARGAHVVIVQPDPRATELVAPSARLLNEVHQVALDGAARLGARLVAELTSPDDLSPMAIEAACLDLLTSASRGVRSPRDVAPWLGWVLEFLRAEFLRAPALADIARVAGVHPAHLVREFRRAYGETPAARMRRLRVEFALPLVTGTEDPLSAIASSAGFADQSHFTRNFRRHFGMSPLACRRAHRERTPRFQRAGR